MKSVDYVYGMMMLFVVVIFLVLVAIPYHFRSYDVDYSYDEPVNVEVTDCQTNITFEINEKSSGVFCKLGCGGNYLVDTESLFNLSFCEEVIPLPAYYFVHDSNAYTGLNQCLLCIEHTDRFCKGNVNKISMNMSFTEQEKNISQRDSNYTKLSCLTAEDLFALGLERYC